MSKARMFLQCAVVLLVLSGCAATTNYAQTAAGLSLGMNKQDVMRILGPAKRTEARKIDGKLIEELSFWTAKTVGFNVFDNEMMADDRVTVVLTDGVVTEWGDRFNPARIMEKSTEQQQQMLKHLYKTTGVLKDSDSE